MVMTFLLFHNSSGRIGSPGSSQWTLEVLPILSSPNERHCH
jgi:hypothetical protein